MRASERAIESNRKSKRMRTSERASKPTCESNRKSKHTKSKESEREQANQDASEATGNQNT